MKLISLKIIKYFYIFIANVIIFVFLIALIETGLFFARKIQGKISVGWIYRTEQQTLVLEEFPCVRMETHPVFSHVPDHRGKCQIKGGFSDGSFVRYDEKKQALPAIITLGGSTTSGFYQHYSMGDTWPYLLSKKLNQYQIINGGHGGYDSSQELLRLILDVRRIQNKISLIISFNGINDISIENDSHPFLNKRVTQMYQEQKWIDQSFLPRFLPNIFSLIRYLSPNTDGIEKKWGVSPRKLNEVGVVKKLTPGERWEANIRAMHSIAASMGAKYYVFLQPTMALEGTQSVLSSDESSKDYKMLKGLLDNQATKEGYAKGYRDLLNSSYRDFRNRCKKIEFCIDISDTAPATGKNYNNPRHHNENGNKIIANTIFKKLYELKLVKLE